MHIPPTKRNKMIAIASVCMLLVALAVSLVFRVRTSSVPQFSSEYGVTLQDYDGKEIRLSHFRYSHLVVMVWATWCPYCSGELKDLIDLKKQYGDTLEIAAVNRAEPFAVAKAYTDGLPGGNALHFLLDPTDALFHSQEGYAMPETMFIGIDGKILSHQRGPITHDEIVQKIHDLLQD